MASFLGHKGAKTQSNAKKLREPCRLCVLVAIAHRVFIVQECDATMTL
ncbi:MAG: hypothetical protein JWQ96_2215 [Segetibacter sp.]|nr:hypothetical protein [Segetibacter sp.]